MIEGEETCHTNREGQGGEDLGGEASEMDGRTDKTEAAAAQQRTDIPSNAGREGEQVWLRGAEKNPDKGNTRKNGGGGLWLSGLALGWS